MPDEALAALSKCGDEQALSLLLERYRPVALQKAALYRPVGLERDDYLQEGLIGLFKAVLTYREDKARFSTYAGTCIENSLRSAYKTAARQKNIPLNTYVSLSEEVTQSGVSPEDEVIGKDQTRQIRQSMEKLLSGLEYRVLVLYLEGCTYEEIGSRLKITQKSTDNAIQRIRRKLKVILE